MVVNRNCIFLLFFSLLLLFTLFGATQSDARSLQSAHAINDSGQTFSLPSQVFKFWVLFSPIFTILIVIYMPRLRMVQVKYLPISF